MSSIDVAVAPMSETNQLFIYELDDTIVDKYQYHSTLSGKWVLFYQKQFMDRVWEEVCKLYHEEKLEGIEFLKTSTAKFNDRLKDSNLGMISFICGPSDSLVRITGYGMSLLKTLYQHDLGPFDVDSMPYSTCGDSIPYSSTGDIAPHARIPGTNNTMLAEIGIPVKWISEHCLESSSTPQGMRLSMADDHEVSPTRESRAFYLHEYDEKIAAKYQYDPSRGGKWILYYRTQTLDLMWTKACKLYRSGELNGIKYLKVSTARYNPRHQVQDMGVIMFHCGPSSNEKLMRSYAKGIIKKMMVVETFKFDQIQYEIDHRNELFMRAPSDGLNCIYTLVIPRVQTADVQQKVKQVGVSTDHLPSKVLDANWLTELNESTYFKWSCRHSLVGHWLVVVEAASLDKVWKKVRDLYRDEHLTGIQHLTVSTAKLMNEREDEPKVGFISCFCGPSKDVELVKSFGENLAKLTNFFDRSAKMTYKFNGETICHIEQKDFARQQTPPAVSPQNK